MCKETKKGNENRLDKEDFNPVGGASRFHDHIPTVETADNGTYLLHNMDGKNIALGVNQITPHPSPV